MKFSSSSFLLASVALASTVVSAISSPDVTVRTTDLPAEPRSELEERTFFNLGDLLGDLLDPIWGTNCKSGLFYWSSLGKCVQTTSDTTQPSTSTKSCPNNWSWYSKAGCCKPNSYSAQSSTSCKISGHDWLSDLLYCALPDYSASSSSSCDSNYQFWWGLGSVCCKNGGSSDDSTTPPADTSCPDNWYYSSKFNHCLPKSSSSSGSTSCSSGSWDSSSKCCKVKRDSNGCQTGSQFWWGLGSFCIDNNHDTSGSCPDTSKSCPNNYSWSTSKGFCIPKTSSACDNVGSCSNSKHSWFSSLKYCKPNTDSNGCDLSSQFWWGLGSFCIDNNHDTSGSCPDTSKSCPNNYSWSTSKGYCIPKTSSACTSVGSCSNSKHSWFSSLKYCKGTTDSNGCDTGSQFWWGLGSFCIDNDHDTSGSCPDTSKSCPNNYSWSTSKGYCIPKTSSACDNVGSCSNSKHSWFSSLKYCKPNTDSNGCDLSLQFWWGLGSLCIDLDHDTSGKCPDSSKSCPNNYSWSTKKGYCIPNNSGSCDNVGKCTNSQHWWFPAHKWCQGTSPSQRKRRSTRITSTLPLGVIDAQRCPDGGTTCPLSAGSSDYECLKPLEEIESCGGCVSLGQGQDCTTISGATSVGCNVGVCEVYKCARGFTVGEDNKSCVLALSSSSAYLLSQARRAKATI